MAFPTTIPVSVSELTGLLAQRLGITNLTGGDYWIQAELDYHVRNAIREFQVLTGYWRERVTLATTANTPFYDLYSSIIPRNVLDTDILAQVGYALLEYAGTPPYINTGQFNINAVAAALGEQVDRILGETRVTVTDVESVTGPTPPNGRLALNAAIIQLHRVEWYQPAVISPPAAAYWTLLDRTDDIQAYGWDNPWQTPGNPQSYMEATTPPLEMDILPPPAVAGTLSLLATASQGYQYANSPVTLALPDDSTWALVWATLEAILRQDAQSRDYRRADYCLARMRQALAVLKTWPCVIQSFPQGVQQPASSLFDLDHWQYGWRNLPAGAPQTVALGGRNIAAVVPIPNGTYSIPIDCIGNSPASVSSRTATFSVANDIVTALLNNAQHAACFKLAGPEFEGTMSLYRAFVDVAESYAIRERAEAVDFDALRGMTNLENLQTPYEMATKENDE